MKLIYFSISHLLNSRTIALESKSLDDLMGSSIDIYVLAGHESSF